MNNHTIYIISAPSGTGKTSLITALRQSMPDLYLSISYTTRVIRTGEQNGKNYFFVSAEVFESMIANNEFIEYAKVFGNLYGTAYKAIKDAVTEHDVILELDWQGAQAIRKKYKNVISIFILPPSYEILRNRLIQRNTDDASTIEARFDAAKQDIRHYNEYNYVLVNEDFIHTVDNLSAIIKATRLQYDKQKYKLNSLISQLTSIDV